MNTRAFKNLAIGAAVITLALATAGLVFAGCASDKESDVDTPTMALTESDNGASLTVGVGDTITITLAGNPTTGYSWESDLSEADVALLTLVGGEPTYQADETDTDVVGAGGTYTFTFEAAAAGQAELKLKYWRSFEAQAEPLETFTIYLTIE